MESAARSEATDCGVCRFWRGDVTERAVMLEISLGVGVWVCRAWDGRCRWWWPLELPPPPDMARLEGLSTRLWWPLELVAGAWRGEWA